MSEIKSLRVIALATVTNLGLYDIREIPEALNELKRKISKPEIPGKNAIVFGSKAFSIINPSAQESTLHIRISQNGWSEPSVICVKSIEEALIYAKNNSYNTLWLVGGKTTLEKALDLGLVDELHVTVPKEDDSTAFVIVSDDSTSKFVPLLEKKDIYDLVYDTVNSSAKVRIYVKTLAAVTEVN